MPLLAVRGFDKGVSFRNPVNAHTPPIPRDIALEPQRDDAREADLREVPADLEVGERLRPAFTGLDPLLHVTIGARQGYRDRLRGLMLGDALELAFLLKHHQPVGIPEA